MLGFIPLIPAILIALIMPESVRWLVSRGRHAEARVIVGKADSAPPRKVILRSHAMDRLVRVAEA
jgi:putative MFS transporter